MPQPRPAEKLRGIYTIVLTPFDERGALDVDGLQAAIARQKEAGVDGLLIGGTYGEFPAMTVDERKQLVEVAVRAAAGLPVVACAAHSDTRRAIDLADHAVEQGALAAMLTPPYVSEVRLTDIVAYFREVGAATGAPLVVYNTPGSGTSLSPEALVALAEVDGVVGVKQGVASSAWMEETQAALQGRLRILCASDLVLPAGLALGMDGGSCTNASLMPERFVSLYRATQANDWATALELHQGWAPLRQLIREFGQPQTTKAAMQLLGLPAGRVRSPLQPLDDDQLRRLERVLARLDLVPLAA